MPRLGRSVGRTMAVVVLAALASAGATSAHAGKVVIITQPPGGGITPKGDPFYDFTANAYLGPGYDIQLGDSFTIHATVGVDHTSPTSQPFSAGGLVPPNDFWSPLITDLPGTTPWPGSAHEPVHMADVSWYLTAIPNLGSPIENCPTVGNPNPGPLYLGQFTFQTYGDFSALTLGFSITLTYTVNAHDCAGNAVQDTGTVTYTYGPAVPEPASIALMGLAVAPVVAAARRHRRRARA
jgi:PEP-CTERM motif